MHRNIKLLAFFNFFSEFSFYSAILIIYFSHITGSFALALSVYSIATISGAIFELPTGIFSDYLGRRKTIIAGAICSIISLSLYAVADSFFILAIGAIFAGLKSAWYSGNNEALLYETLSSQSKEHEYEHFLGRISSFLQFASVIGIVIGGFIAVYSFSLVVWLSVIPQIIALIIAYFLIEPAKVSKAKTNIYSHLGLAFTKLWSNPKLRLITISGMIGDAIGESTYQFRSAFVNTLWPIWAISFSSILTNIGAGISYWFSGKVIKKFGAIELQLFSNIYSVMINIFSVAIPTVASPAIMSTTSLFFGIGGVSKSKLMQEQFSDNERATLGSICSFLGSISFAIFAPILGLMADRFGPASALLFAYIIGSSRIFLNWQLFRKHR